MPDRSERSTYRSDHDLDIFILTSAVIDAVQDVCSPDSTPVTFAKSRTF